MERVVITGMGVTSPLGCDVETFWERLKRGDSGIVALEGEEFDHLRTRIGARILSFDTTDYIDRKDARRMSRTSQLALVAAHHAIQQAKLDQLDPLRVGIMIGSSIGGFSASDYFYRDYYRSGRENPFVIPTCMNSGPSSQVSIRYGYQGPLMTVDAACSSAAHSMGYAMAMIRSGIVDAVVTGGADFPFTTGVLAAWCAMRALSERNDDPATACRPFSADRDGLVLGEGAGIVILESERSARLRQQPVFAEMLGYGATSDGHHITQPIAEGPARAMQAALADAHLTTDQIDYVNAHGTGTPWNDSTETAAIKLALGDRAYQIPVVSNKSALGHSIAASGALELIGCVLSLRDQVVPPTINFHKPDPACDLDYVTDGCRAVAVRHILSNSFSFGGSNAALVVASPQK